MNIYEKIALLSAFLSLLAYAFGYWMGYRQGRALTTEEYDALMHSLEDADEGDSSWPMIEMASRDKGEKP